MKKMKKNNTNDLSKKFRILHNAAEQGLADAQFELGFCYEYGRGVEPNPAEAAHWYRMAAE
ncbi:MAG: tetratricopeptide repeat protein, partial [Muribaculaceae bacterium]